MKTAISESQPEEESDDYLVELMGLKAEFPEEAMAAYGKLYSRYWDFMYLVAIDITHNEETAKDLLSDTFNLVYNKASTFKLGKARNPSNVRLSIQKWMTTIMQHVFYDHYLDDAYKNPSEEIDPEDSYIIGRRQIIKPLDEEYEGFIRQLDDNDAGSGQEQAYETQQSEDSANLTKIRDYIARLSDRDQDVILTIYNYYVPGKNTPGPILDELEIKWVTTRMNIRKIMEKFRKAIKEDLEPQMNLRKVAKS